MMTTKEKVASVVGTVQVSCVWVLSGEKEDKDLKPGAWAVVLEKKTDMHTMLCQRTVEKTFQGWVFVWPMNKVDKKVLKSK